MESKEQFTEDELSAIRSLVHIMASGIGEDTIGVLLYYGASRYLTNSEHDNGESVVALAEKLKPQNDEQSFYMRILLDSVGIPKEERHKYYDRLNLIYKNDKFYVRNDKPLRVEDPFFAGYEEAYSLFQRKPEYKRHMVFAYPFDKALDKIIEYINNVDNMSV